MTPGTQPAPSPDSALTAPPFSGRTPNGVGRPLGRDPWHRARPRRPAVRNAAPVVHRVVRPAGQHDGRLHRRPGDRAGTRILARPARDGHRHAARIARRRLPVDVGSAHGNGAAAQLADGLRRWRRPARRAAVAVVDRVGRAGRPVRWRGAGAAARHPVLGGRADRARRPGRRRLLRLRGHPPSAGGADRRAVRDVRRVRRQARRWARRRDAADARRRRPGRRLRARGHDLVQPGGVVGELRLRLQPVPAGAGRRRLGVFALHVRRHLRRLRLRAGHRHRGGRSWCPSRPPKACGR